MLTPKYTPTMLLRPLAILTLTFCLAQGTYAQKLPTFIKRTIIHANLTNYDQPDTTLDTGNSLLTHRSLYKGLCLNPYDITAYYTLAMSDSVWIPIALRHIPTSLPQYRASLYHEQANRALHANQTGTAEALYKAALTHDFPALPYAFMSYSNLLTMQGRQDEARQLADSLLMANRISSITYMSLMKGLHADQDLNPLFKKVIANGKATPHETIFFHSLLALEREDYNSYYDLLFSQIHHLSEQKILPSDYAVIAPEVAINKLKALRHEALRTGRTAQADTYTYWLGRFCYAAQRYADAASYLEGFADESTRRINSYYCSYQFAKADSLITALSLPDIGYIASPLAPYVKLWLGQHDEALRLAQLQTGFDLTGYATAVSNNIVFPQTLFNIYALTGQRSEALRLLSIRQDYNTYHSDLSTVGNLPLFNGYLQLGETQQAEAIAVNIVASANAYTAPNWGYTYPLVLLTADAPETAASEYASLTADSELPSTAFLPLLAYHCQRGDLAAAISHLEAHCYLLPDEAMAICRTPLYKALRHTPRAQTYLKRHVPTATLQHLMQGA